MGSFLALYCTLVLLLVDHSEAFGLQQSGHSKSTSRGVTTKEDRSSLVSKSAPVLSTLGLAMALQLGSPSMALADDDIARGGTLFTQNCAGCHAGGMNFVKEQKTLKKEALSKFIAADFDAPTVKQWVMNSGQHNRLVFFKMPDGKMKDADWGDVTAYVVDQALNDKW